MIAPAPYFKVSDRSYVARSSLVFSIAISYVIVYSFKFAVGVGPLVTVLVIFTDGFGISLQSSSFFDGTPSLTSATDRKSTRLNSSHVKISYAVFCLKKKGYLFHAFERATG